MTLQEIYDKVVAHLRAQNARSRNGEFCAYRGASGQMCAIGCLIKDEHYTPELEGLPVFHSSVQTALNNSGIPIDESSIQLLQKFQRIHDSHSIQYWEYGFKYIALLCKLTYIAP